MNRIVLTAGLALAITGTALAQEDKCKIVGDLANSVMDARQAGVAMSDIMALPSNTNLTRKMVIEAYKRPRFSTEEFQKSATADFRAEWEAACYSLPSQKRSGNV